MPCHTAPRTLRSRMGALLEGAVRRRGLMIIVLWQAPLGPAAGPDGSIAFLFGGGSDEATTFDCDGTLTSARRIGYGVRAAEADYSITPGLRVVAAGGLMHSGTPQYDARFLAGQVRFDGSRFGAGVGGATYPEFTASSYADDPYETTDVYRQNLPSAYLRIGSAKGLHGRLDVVPPNALGPQQLARLGFGYNAVRRDRASGVIALAGLGGDGSAGLAVDADIPLFSHGALSFRLHHSPGHRYAVSGAMVGVRFLVR